MLDALIESAKGLERAGAWDQALAHYEQALVRLPHEGTPARAAELLRWIGTVHRQRGELELAGEAYHASLAISELNDLRSHRAAVLNGMGAVEHQRGNVAEAEALYTRALELAVALNDQRLAACLDQNLGALHSLRGDLVRALDSYESALARGRTLDDSTTAIRVLSNMGMAHLNLGQWSSAESCFQQAFDLAESTGDTLMTGTVELNRAGLHLQQGRLNEARGCCDRSLSIFGRMKSKYWTAEAYKFQGILHRESGRPEEAGVYFAISLGMAETAQNALLQAEAQMEWAVVHLEAGRNEEGILYLNRALRLFGEMQARREVMDIQERLEKMENLYVPAVQKWSAELLGRTHPEHASHAARVADLSCLLATELGLHGWELTVVRVGALIHDIGYTAIPASVTSYSDIAPDPHPLLRVHAVAGDVIAQRLDFPAEVRSIVRSHHERAGGTGFPDHLAGEDIPLATRIVAVADAFDRLIHPRPRKEALSHASALRSLQGDAGAEFDPRVVGALSRVVGGEISAANAA